VCGRQFDGDSPAYAAAGAGNQGYRQSNTVAKDPM
jgi:hypothetical protein